MNEEQDRDPWLSRKEAARYLGGFSPDTLAVWDCTKRYNLNPVKFGRTVRYRRSDLDKFAQEQTIKSDKNKSQKSCDANKLGQQ